jgi:serine/threonine protein phosphatase PrpC
MKCFYTGLTDPGLVRSVNQDSYYIDPLGRFFVVADGMGGHAGGQEASRIAIQTVQAYLDTHWDSSDSSQALLETALAEANQAILNDQLSNPERADMGTTIVSVLFRKEPGLESDPQTELVWCAHVGDSRLYRLRDEQLEQITEDHTWVARALKAGELSMEQARNHPWRHVLSQCLGREDLNQMDIQAFEIQHSDRLLLCSDGLTEELPDDMIAFYLRTIRAGEKVVSALINAAKEKGGRDNITVVLITVDTSR